MTEQQKSSPIVAILSHNQEISRWLRNQLESEGYEVVTASLTDFKRGDEDLVEFVEHNDPQFVVYDIAPPYFNSWAFAKLIRGNEVMKDRRFLLTTSNQAAFAAAEVTDESVFQITGDTSETQELVDAIEAEEEDESASTRPTRMERYQNRRSSSSAAAAS